MNSGSCGRRRFDQEITFAVMTLEDGHPHTEKGTIPHKKKQCVQPGAPRSAAFLYEI